LLFLQQIMGIKSKIAYRILNSKLESVNRDKKVLNLDEAKSAVVLWTIDEKESFDRLEKELISSGITTSGLCYFKSRKALIPEGINGFTRKQTRCWTEIPKSKLVEDFIHQKFDILIDLTGQKSFPLVYTTALSRATFKIGYAGKAVNYFDWSIEFADQPEHSQLAEQILYYLKRINKTTIE